MPADAADEDRHPDHVLITADLHAALSHAATPSTRNHWERYLKGAATFHGVPMGGVRAVVQRLWAANDLAGREVAELLDLADRWFDGPHSEERIAAVLLIAEHLADRLRTGHADALARPLADGRIADWNVCDWYATKALHRFLTPDGAAQRDRAEALAAWTTAPSLWQRRAGLVAFVGVAPVAAGSWPWLVDLILEAAAANLVSEERFAHTGPGWVLRELSAGAPDRVQAFVDAHPELSPEGRRMALARLQDGPYRRR